MKEQDRDLPMRMPNALPPAVGLSGFELDMYRVQRNLYPNQGGGGGSEEPPNGLSMRDLLTPLFRHKFKIVSIFILCSLATAVYVASMPDYYVSEAGVALDERRRNLVVDPSGEQSNSLLTSERSTSSDSAKSEITILMSTTLAEQLVDAVGVERILQQLTADEAAKQAIAGRVEFDYNQLNWLGKSLYWMDRGRGRVMSALNLNPPNLSPRERAILVVQKCLTVRESRPGSGYLVLEFAALRPELAQEFLTKLLEIYKAGHIEMSKVADPELFQKQLDESRRSYAEKEAELAKEKERLHIVSLDAQKEMLVGRLTQLNTQMDETDRALKAATIRVTALNDLLEKPTDQADMAAQEARDPALDLLRQKIVELRLQQVEMGKRYKSSSQFMRNLQSQIDEYESMLKKQSTSEAVKFTDPIRRSRELELATHKVEIDVNTAMKEALNKEIDKTQNELTVMTGNEGRIKRLEQELQLESVDMEQHRRTLNIAKANEMFDNDRISNVSIKQKATLPVLSAKKPRKMLAILAMGIFGGLFAGVALAFVMEFLNHSIRTNEEVEKWLGLPVLTALPRTRRHLPQMREEIL